MGQRRLFHDLDRAPQIIERNHAVAFRIAHPVGKDGGAEAAGGSRAQHGGKVVGENEIVAQSKRASLAGNPLAPDQKCLGDAFGARLLGVSKAHAESLPVAQQAAELRQISGVEITRMSWIPASMSVESG